MERSFPAAVPDTGAPPALSTAAPVALTNVGDWIELAVTFTNATGLFDLAGHVGFGLYNSGGVLALLDAGGAALVTVVLATGLGALAAVMPF